MLYRESLFVLTQYTTRTYTVFSITRYVFYSDFR